MQRIAVIDYGMGNLRSVSRALEHVVDSDTQVVVTSDRAIIVDSERVVCPGQGAALDCMEQLKQHGMDEAVVSVIADGRPFFGICMGLQVLLTESEENGGTPCLDVIEGKVRHFEQQLTDADSGERLKVPHMGWSQVRQIRPHAMWQGIQDNTRFYFCHSYFVAPIDPDVTVGSCVYGHSFTAVAARDNIFACQFHPEKSANEGLKLLANFARWDGRSGD